MQKQIVADEETPWHRVAEWFEDNWPEVAQAAIAIFFVLAQLGVGLVPSSNTRTASLAAIVFVVLLGIAQAALLVANHRRVERMSTLRKDNISLNQTLTATNQQLNAIGNVRPLQVKPLIFAYLKQIGEQDLDFGEKRGESERLTLYLHNDEKSTFVPVSRFSNSAEFSAFGRREYPDKQGCIAKVWMSGYHCDCGYPNAKDRPDLYVQKCVNDNIPHTLVPSLRMKPRVYCGTVIWNKERTKLVGALMLEATTDRYQSSFLADFMKRQEQGYLGELIHALLADNPLDNSPSAH